VNYGKVGGYYSGLRVDVGDVHVEQVADCVSMVCLYDNEDDIMIRTYAEV